ncbi:MAG: chromosome partitioning protein ParB [Polyangiaceae bacterium]
MRSAPAEEARRADTNEDGGSMATKKAAKKATKKTAKKVGTRKRRGVTLEPTSLGAQDLSLNAAPAELPESLLGLAEQVRADGGAVLAAYREPLGGRELLLVSLPTEQVGPTPFQRDVSDAHVRRLTLAMDKTRRFLDPLIVVRASMLSGSEGAETGPRYLTPNGNHRLTALKELGSNAVIALLVPEREVAYQILALNIEKAHNLRERALEVVRMYRDLAGWSGQKETDLSLEFEEPALVTLGFAYEKRGRLSGGAYNPVLRKVDGWVDELLPTGITERERRADLLIALDDAVVGAVTRFKAAGLTSPYLKNFVVARVNPLRFIKGDAPGFDDLLHTMTKRAEKLDASKIRAEDLAKSGGGPAED